MPKRIALSLVSPTMNPQRYLRQRGEHHQRSACSDGRAEQSHKEINFLNVQKGETAKGISLLVHVHFKTVEKEEEKKKKEGR